MSHAQESLESGQKLVETAGKPVRLVDRPYGRLERVEVDVLPGNTAGAAIYIGGPQTYAGEGGAQGYRGRRLENRATGPDAWSYDNIDPHNVWVDSEVSGEGVSFCLYGVRA